MRGKALPIASLWLLAAATAAVAEPGKTYPPPVGKEHPQIVLWNVEHTETISLGAFRGRKVLLIHFASW